MRYSLCCTILVIVCLAVGCGASITPPNPIAIQTPVRAVMVTANGHSETPLPVEPASATPDESQVAAATTSIQAKSSEGAWGTIKGQIVYGGETVPEKAKLEITKDENHCLAKGPLYSEMWVINPKNKGLKNVFVYLKPDKGKTLPVHDSLKLPPPDVEVDQPICAFEPHVFALREGQRFVAKNSSEVPHNVVITGLVNQHNIQVPPGKSHTFELIPEEIDMGVKISCGQHPWMSGWTRVFSHPYYAITDENGNFEIKLAPAGTHTFMIWHETGFLGGREGRNGRPIQVQANGVTDLGKIEFKPNK